MEVLKPGQIGGQDVAHYNASQESLPQPQPVGADAFHGSPAGLPDEVSRAAEAGPGGEEQQHRSDLFVADKVFRRGAGAAPGFQANAEAESQVSQNQHCRQDC